MARKKKAEIPARFQDQESSHRLHRAEQSQYPDEGGVSKAQEKGQTGGGRNPREVAGDEGGGQVESPARIPTSVEE
jgi:hypothetical protein